MSHQTKPNEFEVELHHPDGFEATRNTIKMLHHEGDLVARDGKFFLQGPDFVAWAAERQGYVKKVIRP